MKTPNNKDIPISKPIKPRISFFRSVRVINYFTRLKLLVLEIKCIK